MKSCCVMTNITEADESFVKWGRVSVGYYLVAVKHLKLLRLMRAYPVHLFVTLSFCVSVYLQLDIMSLSTHTWIRFMLHAAEKLCRPVYHIASAVLSCSRRFVFSCPLSPWLPLLCWSMVSMLSCRWSTFVWTFIHCSSQLLAVSTWIACSPW